MTGPDAVLCPGFVRIENDRISEIGSSITGHSDQHCIDLGRSVIMPGLIDCHCHLELSLLAGKISYRSSLATWLLQIGLSRPKRETTHRRAVRTGAQEALGCGNTTVADISADSGSWQWLADLPIRKLCLAEVLGVGAKRLDAIKKLKARMEPMIAAADGARLMVGISPHAPYSTDAEVYRQALEMARQNNWPLATHLAEGPSELELLSSGRGAWRNMLQIMGLWDGSFHVPHCSPIQWASDMGLLDYPTLIAHANYLDDNDLQLLAGSKCSVVYCPQAHKYFSHQQHRYQELLALGINVVFGSDSLACSSSLGILDQIRSLWRWGTEVSAEKLLIMGTAGAAGALGLAKMIGTLEVGKKADLIAVDISDRSDDPFLAVVKSQERPKLVMIDGQIQAGEVFS